MKGATAEPADLDDVAAADDWDAAELIPAVSEPSAAEPEALMLAGS